MEYSVLQLSGIHPSAVGDGASIRGAKLQTRQVHVIHR
jgi:hypothetical protein